MPQSVFHPPTGSLWRSLRRRRVPEPEDPPLAVLPMGVRASDRVSPMHLALWAPRRTAKAWEVVVSAPPLLEPTALHGDSSLRALVEGGHLLRLLLHFAYDYPEGADLAGTPGVAPPGPSSEPIAWSDREHVEGSRIVVFGPRRVHEPRLSTWCPLTIDGVERRAHAEDALFAVVHACAAVDRLVTFRW